MDNCKSIVTVKVGGSLLSLPDLSERLHAILRELRHASPLIVCGGGEAADLVRRWQPVHGLSDEQAHWLAFRAVSLNEALLSQLMPEAVMAATRDQMQSAWDERRVPILAAEAFTRAQELHASPPLPHNWDVTSDSIAAWAARRLGGGRVVLCKSCDLDPDVTLDEAAAGGLVDAHFPVCTAGLAIEWVNLRTAKPRLVRWRSTPADPARDPSSSV